MSNQDTELREQLTDLLTSTNHYRHTEPDDRLVEFINAHTNKKIEAVLDRLYEKQKRWMFDHAELKLGYASHILSAIEAERLAVAGTHGDPSELSNWNERNRLKGGK